ncbi:MAG: nucleoside-diphosphate sugar epimerase [Gammaproteobacteria bacterium]|nr:MAG: nucleoside-diphosphate sugar epimerase [Gammaproteobacteria bacterium]
MKVLVTGANGHIGANVVRALLEQAHQVRAFVRKSADLRGLEGLEVEYAYGDVMDADSLAAAAQGCEAIIHLAAVYKTWAKTAEEIVEPAMLGTRNIFAAAAKAGIGRIVYTSSVASIGFGTQPDDIRDGSRWNDDPQNPYYIAKTRSEQEAQRLAKEYGIYLVVICPSMVLGPYDYRITPSNRLVQDWVNGVGQTYTGGVNLVDVRDVAAAHVAALTRGENGKRYVAGGDNVQVKDLGQMIKQLTGKRPLHIPLSRRVMLGSASVVEKLCRLLGLQPPFTRDLLYEVVERYGYYNTQATETELGIKSRDAEACLRGAIQWLEEQGKIKRT